MEEIEGNGRDWAELAPMSIEFVHVLQRKHFRGGSFAKGVYSALVRTVSKRRWSFGISNPKRSWMGTCCSSGMWMNVASIEGDQQRVQRAP